jgi:hypothetical protein
MQSRYDPSPIFRKNLIIYWASNALTDRTPRMRISYTYNDKSHSSYMELLDGHTAFGHIPKVS